MGSQVIGNLIAALVLGYLEQYFYVIIMFFICALSIWLMFHMKQPVVMHDHVNPHDLAIMQAAINAD